MDHIHAQVEAVHGKGVVPSACRRYTRSNASSSVTWSTRWFFQPKHIIQAFKDARACQKLAALALVVGDEALMSA
jgi:predicted transcriptional regulator